MAEKHQIFYMCGVCFRASSEAKLCHGRPMLYCDTGCWGDQCRMPLMATNGRLLTRAPRWWLQHRPELAHMQ
jgi:hypothetical protein